MEKAEDPEHIEQDREQDVRKQGEGLLRWDPWRKLASTCLQIQHQSWNQVGGGRTYLEFIEPDKVQDTEVPGKEQKHPLIQNKLC